MAGQNVPVVDWVNPGALVADPYPTYERLRSEAPVALVPMMNTAFITRYQDCKAVEADQEVFSAMLDRNMMHRVMGQPTMLNKDDPEHAAERHPIVKTLTMKAMTESWTELFRKNAQTGLDNLIGYGPDAADLNRDFATPVSALNLIGLLGLRGVSVDDVARWSLTQVAGLANVMDSAEIWAQVDANNIEIDAALDASAAFLRENPDHSMLSAFLAAELPWENIKANIKLAISGGFNEPQHAITSMVWALSEHPEQRAEVLTDPALWPKVFEETLRWISPVGYIPRKVLKDTELGGYSLKAGDVVASMIASANRDASVFEDADSFNIHREGPASFAFGSGVHICAGMWAARVGIGRIAVPALYERLPNVRSAEDGREAKWAGFVFRGLMEYPVTW